MRGFCLYWTTVLHVLQVLPSMGLQLSEEHLKACEYSPLVAAVRAERATESCWFKLLSPDATGGASRDAFDWALSVSVYRHACMHKCGALHSVQSSFSGLSSFSALLATPVHRLRGQRRSETE